MFLSGVFTLISLWPPLKDPCSLLTSTQERRGPFRQLDRPTSFFSQLQKNRIVVLLLFGARLPLLETLSYFRSLAQVGRFFTIGSLY